MAENSKIERATAEILPLQSSFLAAVGYDPQSRILLLRFVSDAALYAFRGVEVDVYHALLDSASKGAFFNQNIRDCFPYTRVRNHGEGTGGAKQ